MKLQVLVQKPVLSCLENVEVHRQGSHTITVAVFGQTLQLSHHSLMEQFIGSPEATPVDLEPIQVRGEVFGN